MTTAFEATCVSDFPLQVHGNANDCIASTSIRFSYKTVRLAFLQFGHIHGRNIEFSLKQHLYRPLNTSISAPDSLFDCCHEDWQRTWRLFRGRYSSLKLESDKFFDQLAQFDSHFGNKRLHELVEEDIPKMLALLFCLSDLGRTGKAPSITSVSRFLHFWNPRVFVKMDRTALQDWALMHYWVKEPVERISQKVLTRISIEDRQAHDFQNWFSLYIAMLLWCAELSRENREIERGFCRFIREETHDRTLSDEVVHYDALAIEWFLLGASHLPPE